MLQPGVTAIGLGLDILGAALIAIPDARTLFSRFSAGALKEARDRMTLIGTKEGDTGFGSLREILEEIEPVAEFGANHGGEEYVEIVVNSLSGSQSVEAAEHQEFSWGDRYVEARYVRDGGWDEADFYDVEDIFDAIAAKERPKTAQLRLYGLVILLCGFAFQLLATLEADPIISGGVALMAAVACLGIYAYRDRLE
ncbi:hypothetical protein JMJ58_12810 [Haloterrigena salifodinae]|uniref:Uncharacterized protein n=1 Tax=Haloterrigena salifodinae TaxID=2675099 RepID=A0A8T8DWY3_9EURY|nr:hypothetical protein [Haloterrigena salifodinae]QRV13832.1 hypothetical protein JMJ58_12810 [Haloterrigena salifodinae]